MSLIVKGGGTFTPAPEGVHAAVCVDVVDLGMVESQWGKRPKCRIVWEIEETMEDGKRFIVGKQYTLSLHQKSALFKDLKSWRGRPFTDEELAGFDLEKVIGAPAQLVIGHEDKDGTVYANVTAIIKATKALKPSGGYIRTKDRADAPQAAQAPQEQAAEPDCPF
jgi:hypothetical protein